MFERVSALQSRKAQEREQERDPEDMGINSSNEPGEHISTQSGDDTRHWSNQSSNAQPAVMPTSPQSLSRVEEQFTPTYHFSDDNSYSMAVYDDFMSTAAIPSYGSLDSFSLIDVQHSFGSDTFDTLSENRAPAIHLDQSPSTSSELECRNGSQPRNYQRTTFPLSTKMPSLISSY